MTLHRRHTPLTLLACLTLLAAPSGCVSLRERLARDMVVADGEATGGLGAEPSLEGPELWLGYGAGPPRLLATDPTGTRVALSDGRRALIWDALGRRVERPLPGDGLPIQSAAFSPQGDLLVVEEVESRIDPGLDRLRVIDLTRGRTTARLRLPCGCLVDYAIDADGLRLRVLLSAEELGGAWVMSWATDGRFEAALKVSDAPLRPGREARFFDQGAQLLLTTMNPHREVARVFDLRSGVQTHAWSLSTAASRLDCDEAMIQCARALHLDPDRQRLFVATGRHDGDALVEIFRVGEPEPLASSPLGEVIPLSWLPTGGGDPALLVQDAEEAAWGFFTIDPDTAAPGQRAAPLSLPAPALMRFPSGWFANKAAAPFLTLFGFNEGLEALPVWKGGRSRIDVDPRSGTLALVSASGEWLWRRGGDPRPLPPLNLKRARATFDGLPRSLSGRPSIVSVTSGRVALLAVEEPDSPEGQATFAGQELGRWEPEEGAIMAAEPLDGGAIVALTRPGAARARLHRLDGAGRGAAFAPARGSGGPAPRELPMPADGAMWRLMIGPEPSSAAVAAVRVAGEGAALTVHRVDLDTLGLTATERLSLPAPPAGIVHASGAEALATFTRHSVTAIPLWGEGRALVDWQAPSWAWIRGVEPLGRRSFAVRLIRRDLASAEWWVAVDFSSQDPVVIGHWRFEGVVAAGAWIAGGAMWIMEERGVLTTLEVIGGAGRPASARVARRTYLEPSGGGFVDLDREGRLRLPAEARARAAALGWLSRRRISPFMVGQGLDRGGGAIFLE